MEKVELMYGDLYLSTNPIISDFSVTNISMEVTGRDINIALHLKRLNLTMWMTLFVPSMCLLVAAEITLFVDREHFQATIMVSLTEPCHVHHIQLHTGRAAERPPPEIDRCLVSPLPDNANGCFHSLGNKRSNCL